MSSAFQDQVGCLQRVVEVLGTLPVRLILTRLMVGGQVDLRRRIS